MLKIIRNSDSKVVREIRTIPELMSFFSEPYNGPDHFQQHNVVERAVVLGQPGSYTSMNGQWSVQVVTPKPFLKRIFGW